MVSRQNQSTWGLATATVSTGIALGGIVALASAFALGRIGRLRPSQSTALVAALGFISVALVPFIKYPATPPAVGNADTIGARTTQYFVMLAISVVAMIAVVLLFRALLERFGTYTSVLISAGAYLAVVILAAELMPTVNEIGDFPADTLWYFRRGSLMTLATLWGVIGIVLTGLIGKLYAEESADAGPPRPGGEPVNERRAGRRSVGRRFAPPPRNASPDSPRLPAPSAGWVTWPYGSPRPRAQSRRCRSTACAP